MLPTGPSPWRNPASGVVRVEACNANGFGMPANQRFRASPASEPPPEGAPDSPADFAVTSSGGVDLSATWSASSGASSYRLRWRKFGEGFLDANQAAVVNTSAAFTVPDYGQWEVRLAACNDDGCSPSAAQTVAIRPESPANLTITSTLRELDLSAAWDAAAGASSYRLRWRQAGSDFASGNEITATTTGAAITVSAYGYWAVELRGCNDAGCGPTLTQSVQVEPLPTPAPTQAVQSVPGQPTGLSVDAQRGSLNVGVAWDGVDGAASYLVRWREAGPEGQLNEGVSADASQATITLANYGDWVVRVEACNSAGCGQPANRRFQVGPPPAATPEPTTEPTPEPTTEANSEPTPEPTTEPEESAPGQPTGLSITTQRGSLSVALDWDDVDGATPTSCAGGRLARKGG